MRAGPLARQLRTLFTAGSFAGLSDGELLSRFVEGRRNPSESEAAFAALVDRHGTIVRRSCLTVLGPGFEADADDAFQAVFLLLARKARRLRDRETVAPWLVQASYRVSRKARVAVARRRKHEALASLRSPIAPATEPDADRLDDRAVLLDEIDRLPPSFRSPILLCALEGRTAADASRILGVAEGTIHSRLSRARALLRDRLSRRGLALVPPPIPRVPPFLPERLVAATVRNASLLSAGRLGAIEAPAFVLSLIASTSRRTLMHSTLLLSLVSAAAFGPIAAGWNPATPSPDDLPKPEAVRDADDPDAKPGAHEPFYVRIIEPDGGPSTEAVLRADDPRPDKVARPDENGVVILPDPTFKGRLIAYRPASEGGGDDDRGPRPRAVGFGLRDPWSPEKGTADQPLVIRLRPLGDPVRIRVLNVDGAPAVGASVSSLGVYQRLRSVLYMGYSPLVEDLGPDQFVDLFGTLVADEEGVIEVAVPGSYSLHFAISERHAVGTSHLIDPDVRSDRTIRLRPSGAIAGIVTDSETGEPVPGVPVQAMLLDRSSNVTSGQESVGRSTGPDGRFVLPGMKPGVYSVRVNLGSEADKLSKEVLGVRVEEGRDAEANLRLRPSKTLSGRLDFGDSDEAPTRPIQLVFHAIEGSAGFAFDRDVLTDRDGRFSISLLPGTYRVSTRSIDAQLVEKKAVVTVPEDDEPGPILLRAEPYASSHPWDGVKLGPRQMVENISLAFALDIAGMFFQAYREWMSWSEPDLDRALRGRVVDEAGHPLAGVRVWPLNRSERLELERAGDLDRIRHVGRSATTDRDGFFLLRDRPREPFELGLRTLADGTRRETVAAGVAEAEFVLPLRR